MEKEFIKPWMESCNQDLVLRFWRHKGRPGTLTIKKYGFKQVFINTIVGELCIKQSDIFDQLNRGSI